MSNTNNTMQTQTSNALPNAIMESRVEDGTETTTAGHMEAYHNVSKEIKAQLDAEAETVQIILTEIDNDIYSTIDACPKCM
ncbi:hypothetical protein Tco_1428446 [Tanacetum coccineum]